MNRILSVIVMTLISTMVNSQCPLTLEDVVKASEVIGVKTPPAVRWNDKGAPYEASDDAGNDEIVARNRQETHALRFTNRKRVWRQETRGDYYLVNMKSGEERKLGAGMPEASLMFAKFSPDGKRVAYVCENNIYVEDVHDGNDGKVSQLTTDGSETIVNGTFDWVYEEEFACRDGFRWSSDGRFVAYWNSDTSGTGWFDIINNVDSLYPTVQHFPYPKAGTLNSAVEIRVVEVATGVCHTLNIDGDKRENYLPRMEFVPGTNTLLVQQMNRAQNTNKLWRFCLPEKKTVAFDGKACANGSILTEDKDEAWVETNDNIHFLKGNAFFTFTSERDGWRHVYRVTMDGKTWECITKGDFDVVSEVAYDEKRGLLYFIAADPGMATERYLYRTDVYGDGKCERVACQEAKGQYAYRFSSTCDNAVQIYSNSITPPQYRMLKMDKKNQWRVDKVVETNDAAAAKARELGMQKEFVKVKSGEWMLDAWIMKPRDFDEGRKYPVIVFVYGEPALSTVQNKWDVTLFWRYLSDQGYVVVSMDGRGTNTPRGRAWRKCIYGEVGVAASEDQAVGIMELCSRYGYMDPERIGITGWSGGGSQTLNCMFRYPQVFKTGVAIAPVADEKLYDTIYQERYMNTPQVNEDGYFRGSPINFVDGLQGNLLLIHGTGDDNVHYQNIERLANKLIEKGKVFYQVSYPMRTHSISEREGTSLHLRKQIVDFFKRNL